MSFCRRVLIRTQSSRPHSALKAFSRKISETSNVNNATISSAPLQGHPDKQSCKKTPDETQAKSATSAQAAVWKRLLQKINYQGSSGPVDNYQLGSRRSASSSDDDVSIAEMSTTKLRRMAEQAIATQSLALVNGVADDLLKVSADREPTAIWKVVKVLLRPHPPLLEPDKIAALFSVLEHKQVEPSMLLYWHQCLVQSLLDHPSPTTSSLIPIVDALIIRLRSHLGPSGVHTITYRPPRVVVLSFRMTRALLFAKANDKAMQLFGELLKTRHLPPEAIRSAEAGTLDFRFMILSVLAKAALHWGWRRVAVEFTVDILKSEASVESTRSAVPFAIEILRDLLDEPSCHDIGECRRLMCEIDSRAEDGFFIPDDIIRLFYTMAQRWGMGHEAERFFAYTQSDFVVRKRQYPPPFGESSLWLLKQLTDVSGNRHLGRQLVNQIISRNELIPLQNRATFIAISAMHGYATQTRALWLKYSQERYRETVVSSAATMLRVVGLFSHIVTSTNAKLERLRYEETNSATVKPKGYFALKRLAKERGMKTDVGNQAVPDQDLATDEKVTLSLPEDYQAQVDDMENFVQCVIEEFRKAHEPLDKARHQHLNALARAYFMVGNFHAGFEVLKSLLRRRSAPSMHDINVALGAIAACNPRSAVQIMTHMMNEGLQPNEVTYGTILHHALLVKDLDLVDSLIGKANRSLGAMSLKSISSLIRHSVDRAVHEKDALHSNLVAALKIMKRLTDGSYVLTPEMGKFCIFAALRVNDPVLAFKFWAKLVRDKTEWGDDEQVFQRRLIADQIEKHHEAGRVSSVRRDRMLKILKHS